jgi:hypothetical protein
MRQLLVIRACVFEHPPRRLDFLSMQFSRTNGGQVNAAANHFDGTNITISLYKTSNHYGDYHWPTISPVFKSHLQALIKMLCESPNQDFWVSDDKGYLFGSRREIEQAGWKTRYMQRCFKDIIDESLSCNDLRHSLLTYLPSSQNPHPFLLEERQMIAKMMGHSIVTQLSYQIRKTEQKLITGEYSAAVTAPILHSVASSSRVSRIVEINDEDVKGKGCQGVRTDTGTLASNICHTAVTSEQAGKEAIFEDTAYQQSPDDPIVNISDQAACEQQQPSSEAVPDPDDNGRTGASIKKVRKAPKRRNLLQTEALRSLADRYTNIPKSIAKFGIFEPIYQLQEVYKDGMTYHDIWNLTPGCDAKLIKKWCESIKKEPPTLVDGCE